MVEIADPGRDIARPVAIEIDERPGQVLALVKRTRAMYPETTFIAVTSQPPAAALVRDATEAGLADLVLLPECPRDMRRALSNIISRERTPTLEGEIIAVMGAKGGVGTSVIAANLAGELAAQNPQARVIIVDLHVYLGDLARARDELEEGLRAARWALMLTVHFHRVLVAEALVHVIRHDLLLGGEVAAEHGDVVLKPLGGRAGQGVVRSHASAPGFKALLELVTNQQTLPVMVQAFLPAVTAGDKRILLVNGEPLGAVNRKPAPGEFRSNLAVGGEPEATELSDQERRICAELAPALQAEGLFFVGIDVIDGRLSEINVTSPTGVREVERLGGIALADHTMARLLAA